MRELFDKREVSEKLKIQLIKFYYDRLSKALSKGYNPEPELYDKDLVEKLKNNLVEFSAFKEASFNNALLEVLEESKQLPTWKEFRQKALEISDLYNVNWLKTEYHQTVTSANMALKWQDFQENKDLYPNLKYVTVGDERVRHKHREWHGFIAPIDHPIWKILLPPNDWGCRCDVIQTDEEPTKGYQELEVELKKEFKNNTALTGKVFVNINYKDHLSKNIQESVETTIEAFIEKHPIQ